MSGKGIQRCNSKIVSYTNTAGNRPNLGDMGLAMVSRLLPDQLDI